MTVSARDFALITIGGSCLMLATEGHSEIVWNDPGVSPFGGTLTEAVLALADCGAPYAAVVQLAWRAHLGDCEEDEVSDREKFDFVLFAGGCLRDVVAHVEGSAGWVDKSRKTLHCHDRAGNHLIIPAACNNVSYTYRPPLGLPPAPIPIHEYPIIGQWSAVETAATAGEFAGPIGIVAGALFPPVLTPINAEIIFPGAHSVPIGAVNAPIVAASPSRVGPSLAPVGVGAPIASIVSPGTPISGPASSPIPQSMPTEQPTSTPIQVPEPSSLLLLLTAIVPVLVLRRISWWIA